MRTKPPAESVSVGTGHWTNKIIENKMTNEGGVCLPKTTTSRMRKQKKKLKTNSAASGDDLLILLGLMRTCFVAAIVFFLALLCITYGVVDLAWNYAQISFHDNYIVVFLEMGQL